MVYPLMESCAQKMVDFVKHYKSDKDLEARSVSQNLLFRTKNEKCDHSVCLSTAYISFYGSKCTHVRLQHRCPLLWSRQAVWIRDRWKKHVWRIFLGRTKILGVSIFTKMATWFHSNTVSEPRGVNAGRIYYVATPLNFTIIIPLGFCRRKWHPCSINWWWITKRHAKKTTKATISCRC